MPYGTKESVLHDLQRLGVTTWDWPGSAPASTGQSALEEIADYCWTAYQKSYRGTGHLVIGRQNNLSQAGLYEKVAAMKESQTLFDNVAQGNLLKKDKWAKVVNDAWILGAVHRFALVRLASPRVMDNLWNKTEHYRRHGTRDPWAPALRLPVRAGRTVAVPGLQEPGARQGSRLDRVR
jgi:hypothetical protein